MESRLVAHQATLRAGVEALFTSYAAGSHTTLVVLGEKKLLLSHPFLSLQIQTCWCSETQHTPIAEFRGKMVSKCLLLRNSFLPSFLPVLINHDGMEVRVVTPLPG